MYIDLHTHTIASDGKFTPTQLVKKAKQLGFSHLAKTDHDNVALMKEFLKAGEKYKINTIPGIEISSRYQGKALHITGLGINYQHPQIKAYSHKTKVARRERGLTMAKKLKQNGWKIKKSELKSITLTRPHVALSIINHPANKKRLLEEFGHLPSFAEFIQKYIIRGTLGFAPKNFYIKPQAAINLIHKAGGLAIIAHPSSKTPEFSYPTRHLINVIKTFNFDGLEVYNHDATAAEIKYLKSLAAKYNLLASAGSDFHGHDSKKYPLGICNNGKKVTAKMCQSLINKLTPNS